MDIICISGLWIPADTWDETAAGLRERGHRPHVVQLPGQHDGNAEATLDDQLEAVLRVVDACEGKPLVVGHSAACTLASLVADRRAGAVAGIALIGGDPGEDGEKYAAFFDLVDGTMPFPGWEPFEGSDSADLTDAQKADLAERAGAVPGGVAHGIVKFTDEARHAVPMVFVCPEFSVEQAQQWVRNGDIPEATAAQDVRYVDIDSGHWPMVSQPVELARVLSEVADDLG